MAVIKSGNSTDVLNVDPTSKAARVTIYDTAGAVVNPALSSPAAIAIDANNTTTAVLLAGNTFTGVATDISLYNQINIEIYARPGVVAGDGSSAKASFYFQFSKDGTNWDVNVPSLVRDPSLVIPIPVINVHKYFRIIYVNDGGTGAIAALGLSDTAGTPTTQTVFRLTTYLLPFATKALSRTMDQGISGSDVADLVRAGIMGKNPMNTYVNKNTSGLSNANNSTAALGAGASFTGTYEEVIGYQTIVVNLDSNLVGTLAVELSQDGTNVTATVTRTFTNVSVGQSYIFIPSARYVRVKYTNTAGTQAFFRLQTIFKSEAVGSIFAAVNTPLVPTSLAQTVVSVPNDGVKTTYSTGIMGIAPALTPTDIFTITGSASKTIRVLTLAISGIKTTAAQTDILAVKRSTANSGGTSAAATAVPHDSNNAAATATVLSYTANPTLGTLVGNLRSRKVFIPSSATATEGGVLVYEFGQLGQAVVLRGTDQVVAVNLNGVSQTGGSFNFAAEWTEE